MRNTLFGFFTGIVVSILVFLLVLPVEQESDADVLDPEAQTSTIQTIESSRRFGSQGVSPPVRGSDLASRADESRETFLRNQVEEARRIIVDATRELEQREFERIIAGPITHSLPLPAELDWVTQDRDRALFHEIIQREYRDDTWATAVESRLQDLIYGRPEIVQELGAPTITCRTTRCQVTFANSAANEAARDAFGALTTEWQSSDIRDQFSMVAGTFWVEQRYEDGVAGVFWSLPRRDE